MFSLQADSAFPAPLYARALICGLLLGVFCTGTAVAESNIDGGPQVQTATLAPAQSDQSPTHDHNPVDIEAILAKMSIREKVGQLLFLGFGGTRMDEKIASFLRDKKPGAVAFFGRNIKSLAQTMRLIRDVRELDPAGIPTFVSVDQEGGTVVRLTKKVTILPSNMALGAIDDTDLAHAAGRALGQDLSLMGFNMNLAPVLDVNSNPDNPVIGIRSFGSDPALVARMGVAYVQGLQSAGVAAVAKHFPGHGDTSADSHFATPVLHHDKKRLLEMELFPFARSIDAGLDALMTAHIALPTITGDPNLPATVSPQVLTGILREEMGYDGLVITDGLEMNGIVSRYGSGDAAVRAVLAGADMVMVLWFPEKKEEVHKALLNAVRSGKISEERLDRSVRRVLRAKAKRGLFSQKLLPVKQALKALQSAKHRNVVRRIAERAVTLVKNDTNLLPLRKGPKTLVVTSESTFQSVLSSSLPNVDSYHFSPNASAARMKREARKLAKRIRKYERVVFGLWKPEGSVLVKAAKEKAPEVPAVVVSFGSPYLVSSIPPVEAYLCAYGFRAESERAAAQVLLGNASPSGRLPVSLPDGPQSGHGLRYEGEGSGELVAP